MNKKKILFVCLGNICRSPAAEGIMKAIIKENKYEDKIEVDSAGTIAYHEGEGADPRMKKTAKKRGYDLTGSARKFNPEKDFDYFDYIVTMDDENFFNVLQLDHDGKYTDKVHKMVKFSQYNLVDEVPDPYYSGQSGFENVLDILEDACFGLFQKVKEEIESQNSN